MTTNASPELRTATSDDLAAVLDVTARAFGGPVERELVRLLTASDAFVPDLSLVALLGGRIVGHVMLSDAEVVDEAARHRVLSLAPLSVDPDAFPQAEAISP